MDHRNFVLENIHDVNRILSYLHGTPDHNNKKDPLDELVFILLSRRTRNIEYERVYDELRERFPSWESVKKAPDEELMNIIGKAGLGSLRVRQIKNNLTMIHGRFKEYSLDRLRKWNNKKVEEYLLSLDGIQKKSAYCIMMYSLDRPFFPVDTHVGRICKRMGLVDSDLDHRKVQDLLENVFPEDLRYSLHVNMISHGRKICRSSNPRCGDCLIAGYCMKNRKDENSEKPVFLDLFSGAGGMSLGFEKAGFSLEYAFEMERWASSTLYYNRPHMDPERMINKDIRELHPEDYRERRVDVIVAGPPCQEFSKVRKNGFGNRGRNELYKEVLRFVNTFRPPYVVIENVPGMASHLNRTYVNEVKDGLENAGYAVDERMINARDYSIPQKRTRLLFIARKRIRNSRKKAMVDLQRIWNMIDESKSPNNIPFSDGISGLPVLGPGEGDYIMKNNRAGRRTEYAQKLSDSGNTVYNHVARPHNKRDLEAYAEMKDGENALDLHRRRPDLMIYSTESFPTKYYKIRRDSPSPTIVAHLNRDANSFIHPTENRGITPREAARLQSFPDSYRFLGSFGRNFVQIGNAVPPLLAQIVAEAILKSIREQSH
jgi:DNA (cytosine-5)-methyltransferase 1